MENLIRESEDALKAGNYDTIIANATLLEQIADQENAGISYKLLEFLGRYEEASHSCEEYFHRKLYDHPGNRDLDSPERKNQPKRFTKSHEDAFLQLKRLSEKEINRIRFKKDHKAEYNYCAVHHKDLILDKICPDSKRQIIVPKENRDIIDTQGTVNLYAIFNEPLEYRDWMRLEVKEKCFAINNLYIEYHPKTEEIFSGDLWGVRAVLICINFSAYDLTCELEQSDYLKFKMCRISTDFDDTEFTLILDNSHLSQENRNYAINYIEKNEVPSRYFKLYFVDLTFTAYLPDPPINRITFQFFLKFKYTDASKEHSWEDTGKGFTIIIYPPRTKLYQILVDYYENWVNVPLPVSRILGQLRGEKNLELGEELFYNLMDEIVSRKIIEVSDNYREDGVVKVIKILEPFLVFVEPVTKNQEPTFVDVSESIKGVYHPKEADRGIFVFISYATEDAERFRISYIAESLRKFPEITNVVYWQSDLEDDIIQYMEENIKKCDAFLMFCSSNAAQSTHVGMEWRAALQKNKKIIPIFLDQEDIPALLSPKLGLQFRENEIDGMIKEIYQLILKKVHGTTNNIPRLD